MRPLRTILCPDLTDIVWERVFALAQGEADEAVRMLYRGLAFAQNNMRRQLSSRIDPASMIISRSWS